MAAMPTAADAAETTSHAGAPALSGVNPNLPNLPSPPKAKRSKPKQTGPMASQAKPGTLRWTAVQTLRHA